MIKTQYQVFKESGIWEDIFVTFGSSSQPTVILDRETLLVFEQYSDRRIVRTDQDGQRGEITTWNGNKVTYEEFK